MTKKITASDSSEEKRKNPVISGDDKRTIPGKSGTIPGEANNDYKGEEEKVQKQAVLTQEERIAESTKSGGLNDTPDNFDDPNGDWRTIDSPNVFEVLYLDHKQYEDITPDLVKKNYKILSSFWTKKNQQLLSGGQREQIKKKYGEGVVEKSITKLKAAYDKLQTSDKIFESYKEVEAERLSQGENAIKGIITMMLKDNIAEKEEIKYCLDEGEKTKLEREEAAEIVKRYIDNCRCLPYGEISGESIEEQLTSVEAWMTEDLLEVRKKEDKEREESLITIAHGKKAKTVEEVGEILFDDEENAKEYINNHVIDGAVKSKDLALSSQISNIAKSDENITIKYLEIIYRLNPKLPYRFGNEDPVYTIPDLCKFMFKEENIELAKEHIKRGFIQVWLKHVHTESFPKYKKIRDTARNIHLAYLEFIYTFKPNLPYRLIGDKLAHTPLELCEAIDYNETCWKCGAKQLYDKSISVWLNTVGHEDIVKSWEYHPMFEHEDDNLGLEFFLQILNCDLEKPLIKAERESINIGGIPSGKKLDGSLLIKNITRGCTPVEVTSNKEIPGLRVSKDSFHLNEADGITSYNLLYKIDTTELKRGTAHKTNIYFSTPFDQVISIPLSFKVIFPWPQFMATVTKYALFFAFLGALLRGILYLFGHDAWLTEGFSYYLNPGDVHWQATPDIFIYPLVVLSFITVIWFTASKWRFVQFFLETLMSKDFWSKRRKQR